jgi:hypothetical protein
VNGVLIFLLMKLDLKSPSDLNKETVDFLNVKTVVIADAVKHIKKGTKHEMISVNILKPIKDDGIVQ